MEYGTCPVIAKVFRKSVFLVFVNEFFRACRVGLFKLLNFSIINNYVCIEMLFRSHIS